MNSQHLVSIELYVNYVCLGWRRLAQKTAEKSLEEIGSEKAKLALVCIALDRLHG